MADIYGNQINTSWSWDYGSSEDATYGTRFQVTTAGELTRAGWYQPASGDDSWRWIGIYGPTGTLLWEDTTPVLASAAGWTWTPISPALAVSSSTTYTVAARIFGSRFYARNGSVTNRSSPPAPFIFDDTPSYRTAGGPAYPTTAQSAFYAINVTWGEVIPPAPPGPGEGDPTTTGDLNSWLSAEASVQTHETDGLPWLTKVAVDATKNAVDAGRIVIDATKDIVELIPKRTDSEWAVVQKLWQIAGVLTEAEIDLWNLFAKRAPGQLTGPTPGGGSAFFGPSGGQVAERAEVAATNGELLWHRTQTTNWLDAVPGGDWLLVDTLEWDAPFAWEQEADVYVVHLTAVPTYVSADDVAGSAYYPKAAWWAPITSTLVHERRYCEFEFSVLHALPMRCAGILFRPRANFTGTIEAWLRPTPPVP